MIEPPENLPEAGWIEKRKNDDDEMLERLRLSHRVLWLVALVFAAIIVGMTVILANYPALFLGDERAQQTADMAALQATAQMLNGAVTYIDGQAMLYALDLRETLIALDQTATRLAEVVLASETQSALNFAATQRALDAQMAPVITPLPRTSDPAVQLEDDFSIGISGGRWASDVDSWMMPIDGMLTAVQDGAWLLTRRADFDNYTLEVYFTPQTGTPGSYDLLLNAQPDTDDRVTMRLASDGQQITEASLFTSASLIAEESVANMPLFGPVLVRVEVHDGWATVFVYATQVLQVQVNDLPARGAVGIQMPAGTTIQWIRLTTG